MDGVADAFGSRMAWFLRLVLLLRPWAFAILVTAISLLDGDAIFLYLSACCEGGPMWFLQEPLRRLSVLFFACFPLAFCEAAWLFLGCPMARGATRLWMFCWSRLLRLAWALSVAVL